MSSSSSSPEFLTALGAALAIFLSSAGASIGSVHAGAFAIRASGSWGWKSFIPIIIAGVLAIYGTIVAVLLCGKLTNYILSEVDGFKNLSAGLSVGSACLASGWGIGTFIQTQSAEKSSATTGTGEEQPLLQHHNSINESPATGGEILKTLCVLVFLEAIGLYGLIVAVILQAKPE